jgi:hypothetical protein
LAFEQVNGRPDPLLLLLLYVYDQIEAGQNANSILYKIRAFDVLSKVEHDMVYATYV